VASTPDDTDYAGLGFKCGLEIHQQLATTKLFCRCATDDRALDDENPDFRFLRRLRPTQSELGEVDAAARAEAERAKRFEYLGHEGLSCLVEADEEPPHEANEDAIDVALTMALLVGARPVDEVQWMRKIVIDGSNTGGFQRTGLVALGGRVDDVGIQTIALEEDSARRIGEAEDLVRFGLDRLGIPLVEIATDPDIRDPEHARAVAARIGALLRATGQVKRGIGTIRQDLNVSIRGGTRIEIKGVQELNAIPRVIANEARRQRRLIEIAAQLKKRGTTPDAITYTPVDVTKAFEKTESKILRGVLKHKGSVLGTRLPGFHGLLGAPDKAAPRLGRELADYARQEAGVRGLLHGDELPGLGIETSHTDAARQALAVGEKDSYVLVAAPRAQAERALAAVVARARAALEGVPKEVRAAQTDDTTSYLRPMPGAARMYPETDVPPAPVTPARLGRVRSQLPEPPEKRIEALAKDGLSKELAAQVVHEGIEADVRDLTNLAGDATLAARLLLATVPEVERTHDVTVPRSVLQDVLTAYRDGAFAKEGIQPVLAARATGQAATVDEAIRTLGLAGVDEESVRQAAVRLVDERQEFVLQREGESVGPLMGVLMKEFRGKADGQLVSRCLKEAVDAFLATQKKNA
jgi:glutamyl-tRNA(Gln) amidotransferase subunit E